MSKAKRASEAAKRKAMEEAMKKATVERLAEAEKTSEDAKANCREKAAAAAQKAREAADKAEAAYQKTLEALDESAVNKAMAAALKEEKKAKKAANQACCALKDAEDADKVANLYDLKIIHEIAAGVDVHRDMLVVTVLGGGGVEGDVQTFEFGTLKKDLDALGAKLNELGVQCVLMESTGVYWKEPFRRLQAAGLNVILGNARHIKTVPGRKTDTADSRWLANLARFGLVRPSRVLSKEMDELRGIARTRQGLVEEMTSNKNRVIKLLVEGGFNLGQVASDVFGVTGMMVVQGLLAGKSALDIIIDIASGPGWRLKTTKEKVINAIDGKMSEDLKTALMSLLDVIVKLDENINLLENRLEKRLIETGHENRLKLLMTIPGMSKVSAMITLAELGGDVSGFRSAEALSSWAGMSPGNNESAGKRKSGRTLFGNKRLKRIMCEAAWAATKTECYFKEKWKSMMPRLGFKKGIVAIGHKMLKVVYHMLSRMEIYRDPMVNLEEVKVRKNAPRWMKMMAQYSVGGM